MGGLEKILLVPHRRARLAFVVKISRQPSQLYVLAAREVGAAEREGVPRHETKLEDGLPSFMCPRDRCNYDVGI